MTDPYGSIRDFEKSIADYTGSPHVVVVNSCSMALLLAFAWYKKMGGEMINMPSKTYPSVPMSAHWAGLDIVYINTKWDGVYECYPSHVWDCAKRFRKDMYIAGQVQCVSFHVAKLLKVGQGGAILHDNREADAWYRIMRFDGRTEGIPTNSDTYLEPGYHCYMSPDVAARGNWMMYSYAKEDNHPDDPMVDYPDMSKWPWHK